MSVFDKEKINHTEYYPTMYQDGFTPEEILMAFRQTMYDELMERDDEEE